MNYNIKKYEHDRLTRRHDPYRSFLVSTVDTYFICRRYHVGSFAGDTTLMVASHPHWLYNYERCVIDVLCLHTKEWHQNL